MVGGMPSFGCSSHLRDMMNFNISDHFDFISPNCIHCAALGRFLYIQGYMQAANKRGTGFGIQAVAAGVLWSRALIGVILALVTGN
jgi:hypothetical protein